MTRYSKRILGNLDEGVVANALRIAAEHRAGGGVVPEDDAGKRELHAAHGVVRTLERRSQPWVTGPGGRVFTASDNPELMPPGVRAQLGISARPARARGGSVVDVALGIAGTHLARFGMPSLGAGLPYAATAPGSGRNSIATSVPVLPQMAHAYVKHAVRQRPRFDDGGDASSPGGSNDPSGGWGGGSLGGYGIGGFGGAVGQVSGGSGLGGTGDAVGGYSGYSGGSGGSWSGGSRQSGNAGGSDGGYSGSTGGSSSDSGPGNSYGGGMSIGGFGGAVGSVSSGGGDSDNYGGGWSGGTNSGVGSSSWGSPGGSTGDVGTSNFGDGFSSFGQGLGQLNGLGSFDGNVNLSQIGGISSPGNFGFSGFAGSQPAGYTSSGTCNTGSIGPSGIASGDGINSTMNNGLGTPGFGNFGSSQLGVLGSAGALNGGNMEGMGSALSGGMGYDAALAGQGFAQMGQGLSFDRSLGSFGTQAAGAASDPAGQTGFGTFGLDGMRAATPTNLAGAVTSDPAAAAYGAMPSADAFGAAVSPGLAAAYAAHAAQFGDLGPSLSSPTTAVTSAPLASATPYGDLTQPGQFGSVDPAQNQTLATYAATHGMLSGPTGDPGMVGDAPALTVHAAPQMDFGLNGFVGSPVDFNKANLKDSPTTLGTSAQPGFDNFGLGSDVMTKSLAPNQEAMATGTSIGGYTPAGWTNAGELANMAQSPGNYDYMTQRNPALAQFNNANWNGLTAQGAQGLLGISGYESGGNQFSPTGIDPSAINPGKDHAMGMFQDLGDRKTGMLAAAGINPNQSLSDIHDQLNGTVADQLGYGLNEIVTNPAYAKTFSAMTDPSLTARQVGNIVTNNFERPSEADKQSSFDARMSTVDNWSNAVNAQNPAAVAGLGNLGGAAISGDPAAAAPAVNPYSATVNGLPSTTTQQDVQNALNIARGENLTSVGGFSPSGYDQGKWSDNANFNPAVHSGEDSMSPEDYAAEAGRWQRSSSAMTDAANLDAQIANRYTAGEPASTTATPPSVGPSGAAEFNPAVASGEDTLSAPPSYFPGEKKALTWGVNAAVGAALPPVGIINALSGMFGGPTIGGYLANHSSPGSVSPLGGQGGNTHGATQVQDVPATRLYGNRQGGSSSSTPIADAVARQDSNAIANAAYQTALSHMTAPPAPQRSRSAAVPLVAPTVSPASFYDPMSDPAVIAALRQSRASGGSVQSPFGPNWQNAAPTATSSGGFSGFGANTAMPAQPSAQPAASPVLSARNPLSPFGPNWQAGLGGAAAPVTTTAPVAAPTASDTVTAISSTPNRNVPGPPPAPQASTATPLVAPTVAASRFYNPLGDPVVMAAMRQAGVA